MKKVIAMLMILALVFVVGCSKNIAEKTPGTSVKESQQTQDDTATQMTSDLSEIDTLEQDLNLSELDDLGLDLDLEI